MAALSTTAKVLENRVLGGGSFLLRFERRQMTFRTGQYVSIGVADHREQREYSIFSGENDPDLTVLIKEVEGGLVSKRLARLVPGDILKVDGPFGYFTLDEALKAGAPVLFIATGTGISPFHGMISTYPDLVFRCLHGVRTLEDLPLLEGFDRSKVISCVSREAGSDFHGRVTTYLRENPIDPTAHAFLCGNCDMIYEAFDILRAAGLGSQQISTEVYF